MEIVYIIDLSSEWRVRTFDITKINYDALPSFKLLTENISIKKHIVNCV